MVVVESMHERKREMAARADGFIALPGGAGTLEEIFEQWTWAQLGAHQKPCGFLNVGGYFDALKDLIGNIIVKNFMKSDYADMLIFSEQPAAILDAFARYVPPVQKWSETEAAVRP